MATLEPEVTRRMRYSVLGWLVVGLPLWIFLGRIGLSIAMAILMIGTLWALSARGADREP